MSSSIESLKSDFWKSLNNYNRVQTLDELKSHILTLVFLKHISVLKSINTSLDFRLPKDCDFQSILNLTPQDLNLK